MRYKVRQSHDAITILRWSHAIICNNEDIYDI
jgi:hypothetical protein